MSRDKAARSSTSGHSLLHMYRVALSDEGFSMVELIAVMAVLTVLVLIAIPNFNLVKNKARSARAMEEIRAMEKAINAYSIDKGGTLPNQLADIGMPNAHDPWGNLYVYVPNVGTTGRWGHTEVLNSDFDLYSLGADGAENPNPNATVDAGQNADDIVRAADGGYVGLGRNF